MRKIKDVLRTTKQALAVEVFPKRSTSAMGALSTT